MTIAGSCGKVVCRGCGLGGSHTCKSLISLPRNIIYSNISSLGATGRSVGRSSVPNERTENRKRKNNYYSNYIKYHGYLPKFIYLTLTHCVFLQQMSYDNGLPISSSRAKHNLVSVLTALKHLQTQNNRPTYMIFFFLLIEI